MAEQDDGDKTEEPSEKKIREAKEKGQFAKSREFAPLSVLAVGYSGLLVLSPSWGTTHQSLQQIPIRWTAAVEEDYNLDCFKCVPMPCSISGTSWACHLSCFGWW